MIAEMNLEMQRTKLTLRYLAEHVSTYDAEKLLCSLRESVAYLERRIAREKINIARESDSAVLSNLTT